jgi:hypothetical protein
LGSNKFGIESCLGKNQSKGVTDSIMKFCFVEFGARESMVAVDIESVTTETFFRGRHDGEVRLTLEGKNV